MMLHGLEDNATCQHIKVVLSGPEKDTRRMIEVTSQSAVAVSANDQSQLQKRAVYVNQGHETLPQCTRSRLHREPLFVGGASESPHQ
jgi:hypothetical protein